MQDPSLAETHTAGDGAFARGTHAANSLLAKVVARIELLAQALNELDAFLDAFPRLAGKYCAGGPRTAPSMRLFLSGRASARPRPADAPGRAASSAVCYSRSS